MFNISPRGITARSLLVFLLCLALPLMAQARNVIITTPLGDIEIELLEDDAPLTVANFLTYVNDGRYTNAFIHRKVSNFIIQGGGYTFLDGTATAIVSDAPVVNEFKVSNTRGTVAMAKLNDQPDSATNEWFINFGNNSANLDNQNGGFTVFARVTDESMAVVDAINALSTINGGGPFTDLPVINFTPGDELKAEHLMMTAISENQQAGFQMNTGLNDAWFDPDTDGQGFFITVFPDLNVVNLAWFTYDTQLPGNDDSANLGDPGHRWLTALGTIEGNKSVMTVTVASGGLFDTATDIEREQDGTITLTFDDCHSGTIEYDLISINSQGVVPIERVVGDNAALCETLASE